MSYLQGHTYSPQGTKYLVWGLGLRALRCVLPSHLSPGSIEDYSYANLPCLLLWIFSAGPQYTLWVRAVVWDSPSSNMSMTGWRVRKHVWVNAKNGFSGLRKTCWTLENDMVYQPEWRRYRKLERSAVGQGERDHEVVWKFGLGFRKVNHDFTAAVLASTVSNSGLRSSKGTHFVLWFWHVCWDCLT